VQYKRLSKSLTIDVHNNLCGPVAVRMIQQSQKSTMRWYAYIQRKQDLHLWTNGVSPTALQMVAQEMELECLHSRYTSAGFTRNDGIDLILKNLDLDDYQYALIDIRVTDGWHLFAVVNGVLRDVRNWASL